MSDGKNRTWLNIEEVADHLRCSLRYLREKAANKEIPFTRFGGKALFNRQRIDDWMLEREETPGESEEKREQEATAPSLNLDTSILPDCDRDKVSGLVQELIDFKEHFVTSLGNNLRKDLQEYNFQRLSDKVYSQVSRWCHPNRDSSRERKVKPIIHQLSESLFGCVIERTKHPSYKGESSMSNKRHKYRDGKPAATFEELNYAEQAKAINMHEINLQKMRDAHVKRGEDERRT